ncbi:MAG: hypothetical protein NW224_04035 [Leptolyngbyaceae cyanobacterium bins.302]|nr:hypothetical protein [Leptolyngbyaceae cyanobacterium bins.302]
MNFQRQIYIEVKGLFPDGAVEALISRPAGADVGVFDAAVKLVHTQTGIEITCDEFPTQIENYIAATIRLRIACDSEPLDRPS